MQYGKTSSFDRTLRRLPPSDRTAVKEALTRFVRAFDVNQIPEGLGLKKLRGALWEIRADLALRVLFRLEGSLVTFVMAGTHEAIRRYLKEL